MYILYIVATRYQWIILHTILEFYERLEWGTLYTNASPSLYFALRAFLGCCQPELPDHHFPFLVLTLLPYYTNTPFFSFKTCSVNLCSNSRRSSFSYPFLCFFFDSIIPIIHGHWWIYSSFCSSLSGTLLYNVFPFPLLYYLYVHTYILYMYLYHLNYWWEFWERPFLLLQQLCVFVLVSWIFLVRGGH